MDGLWQIILIAGGTLLWGLLKKAGKLNDTDEETPGTPTPGNRPKRALEELRLPLPTETLRPPTNEKKQASSKRAKPRATTPQAATPSFRPADEGVRNTVDHPEIPPTSTPSAESPDFRLRTPEDARRAVIWAEILERKY